MIVCFFHHTIGDIDMSHISHIDMWDNPIDSIVKKAQQRLTFLHQLRKFNLHQELLKQFYSAILESILCTSITVWFGSATKSDLRRLRRVVRTAERIIGTTLPTLQELYLTRVSKRAGKITLDPHIQHTHSLNCYRLVDAWGKKLFLCLVVQSSVASTRHRNSFFPQEETSLLPPSLIYLTHIFSLHFNCT